MELPIDVLRESVSQIIPDEFPFSAEKNPCLMATNADNRRDEELPNYSDLRQRLAEHKPSRLLDLWQETYLRQ
jgi:hypothetical protein